MWDQWYLMDMGFFTTFVPQGCITFSFQFLYFVCNGLYQTNLMLISLCSVYFNISVMRDSSETSASKFFSYLCETLNQMKGVIERVHDKTDTHTSTTHKAHL